MGRVKEVKRVSTAKVRNVRDLSNRKRRGQAIGPKIVDFDDEEEKDELEKED